MFDNEGTEARLELRHRPWAGWDGAFGLQAARRDFVAIGDEAFVPGSKTRDTGLFWVAEQQFGALKLELGARHDRVAIKVNPAEAIGRSRDFSATSLSGAAKWAVSDALHFTFALDRAQRAPVAEELYSSGEHVATRSFEFGNPDLDVETANRAELGVHWHAGPLELRANVYHVAFRDFIYLADTGVELEGLAVRAWNQEDARFSGGEVEAKFTLADNASGRWQLRGFGDVVRARLAGSGSRALDIELDHGDHEDHVESSINLTGNLPRIVAPRVRHIRLDSARARSARRGALFEQTASPVRDRDARLYPGECQPGLHLDTRAAAPGDSWTAPTCWTRRRARIPRSSMTCAAPGSRVTFGSARSLSRRSRLKRKRSRGGQSVARMQPAHRPCTSSVCARGANPSPRAAASSTWTIPGSSSSIAEWHWSQIRNGTACAALAGWWHPTKALIDDSLWMKPCSSRKSSARYTVGGAAASWVTFIRSSRS